MRCPKCGYISFDDRESCGKCSRDLKEMADQLAGTVSRVAPPEFLAAALAAQAAPAEEDDSAGFAVADAEFDPEQLGIAQVDEEAESDEVGGESEGGAPDDEAPVGPEPIELTEEPAGESEPAAMDLGPADGTPVAAESGVEDLELKIDDLPVVEESELDLAEPQVATLPEPAVATGGESAEAAPDLDAGNLAAGDDLFDLTNLDGAGAAGGVASLDIGAELPESAASGSPPAASHGGLEDLTGGGEKGDEPAAGLEKTASAVDMEGAVIEDVMDLLDSDDDRPADRAKGASGPPPGADDLTLTIDDDSPLGAAGSPAEGPPVIPDLGLSLESAEEDPK